MAGTPAHRGLPLSSAPAIESTVVVAMSPAEPRLPAANRVQVIRAAWAAWVWGESGLRMRRSVSRNPSVHLSQE